MKFLISLLLVLQTCTPAYTASTRTVVADQIKNSALTNTYAFPASGDTLVGRTSTDTLTNKTLTTPAIDIPLFTDQASKPATPAAGKRKFYSKTTGKFYQLDSAGVERELGAGGTGTNFVVGGDAEGGSIFATYKDAAGSSPVDGTAGIPTVANITTTSSSPLVGANSFLLTHPASNVQGEGWSYDFTIDAAYQAKVLQLSFDYVVNSGTFVAGTATTDSDVTVWIYDKTNNVLIQPSSYKLLSQSATVSDKFNATFQTAANSTSYRLIFHNASASTSAFTLRIDSVTASPSTYVYGTPITDWVAWTPTGSWTGSVSYTGLKRRVGDTYEYQIKVLASGAPTGTTLTVNTVETIDVAKLIQGGSTFENVGMGAANDSGTAYHIIVAGSGTNSVQLRYQSAVTGASSQVSVTSPFTFGAADYVTATFSVPILGLSSSVQMSDSADTRVVNWTGYVSSNQAVTANVTDIPLTTRKDTHNGWGGSSYIVRVPGDYSITNVSSPTTAVPYYTQVYVNGSLTRSVASSAGGATACGATVLNDLKTGDVISFRSGTSLTVSADVLSSFTITRISGPSVIAATESINMSYLNTAGTSIGISATVVPFATKEWDSHGLWDGTKFTAQIPGKYQISLILTNAGVNLSTSQGFFSDVYKNNTFYKHIGSGLGTGATNNHTASGTVDITLNAGEFFDIRAISSVATTLLTSSGYNSLAVKRIGN